MLLARHSGQGSEATATRNPEKLPFRIPRIGQGAEFIDGKWLAVQAGTDLFEKYRMAKPGSHQQGEGGRENPGMVSARSKNQLPYFE